LVLLKPSIGDRHQQPCCIHCAYLAQYSTDSTGLLLYRRKDSLALRLSELSEEMIL
jgi:hypothetical protein